MKDNVNIQRLTFLHVSALTAKPRCQKGLLSSTNANVRNYGVRAAQATKFRNHPRQRLGF